MTTVAPLEAEIGITLNKLTKQLATAEARMNKTASGLEKRFTKTNATVSKSFQQVNKSTSAFAGNGLRQVSMQLSQVAQQTSATGQPLKALAIQLPDIGLAFGTIGIAAGVAAGALLPLIGNLIGAGNASEEMIEKILGSASSLEGVRGQLGALRDLQDEYTSAIDASAGASGNLAAAVAQNSMREFEARKQVVEVELELLRVRQKTNAIQIKGLEDEAAAAAAAAKERARVLGGDPVSQYYPGGGSASVDDTLTAAGIDPDAWRDRRLALEKLRAEQELTTLAIEETSAAINGEFRDVSAGGGRSGAPGAAAGQTRGPGMFNRLFGASGESLLPGQGASSGGGKSGGRASGGGRSSPAGAVNEVNEALTETDRLTTNIQSSAGSAFTAIVTGSESAKDALSGLLQNLAQIAASSAWRSLMEGGGGGAAGSALAGMISNVVPFAKGGVVNGPTLFPMANGAGLMGEAGPEAIMPLKRGPDGRLGVAASGSSNSVTFAPVIDARGADIGAVQRIEAGLQEFSRNFDARFAAASVNAARGGGDRKWR